MIGTLRLSIWSTNSAQELFIVFGDKGNIGYVTLYTNQEDFKMYLVLS